MTTNKLDEIEGRHAARSCELQAMRAQVYPRLLSEDCAHEDRAYLLSRVRELEIDVTAHWNTMKAFQAEMNRACEERDRLRAVLDMPVTEEELQKYFLGYLDRELHHSINAFLSGRKSHV